MTTEYPGYMKLLLRFVQLRQPVDRLIMHGLEYPQIALLLAKAQEDKLVAIEGENLFVTRTG